MPIILLILLVRILKGPFRSDSYPRGTGGGRRELALAVGLGAGHWRPLAIPLGIILYLRPTERETGLKGHIIIR